MSHFVSAARSWRLFRSFACVVVLGTLVACSGGGGGGGSSSGSPTGTVALTAPQITAQPQSQAVGDGQPATFSVGVSGSPPLVYQWSRGGQPIAGATGASYSIPSAQLSDSGATFTVSVTNAVGSAQSAVATLTVNPIAPSIADNTAHTISVVAGNTATLAVVATGSAPLTFQWRRAGVPIAGATTSTFTTAATTVADNGAQFDVVVSNAAGSITSAPFTLAVTTTVTPPSAPVLPSVFTTTVGSTATFTAFSTAQGPLSYQWYREGVAIPGAQSQSYALTNVQLSDNNAHFTVDVTNAGGTAGSFAATLIVLPQRGLGLVAGNIGGPGAIDGAALSARFDSVTGVALDSAGNAFASDGSAIRELTTGGVVTTFAGAVRQSGTADGTGSAARFVTVGGLLVDSGNNLFVTDSGAHTLRRVTAGGVVTTIGGAAGVAGSTDGPLLSARFNAPRGIAGDTAGNLYVADSGNHTIRKIDAGGNVTTLAGAAGSPGSSDGTGASARFNTPVGIAVDASGNLYVADSGNHTIRQITPAGVVATLAGSATSSGTVDGTGAAARFVQPTGITIDAASNLYVADVAALVVRKIAPGAVVTTIAGTPGAAGSVDGTGGAARFASPSGVATNAAGTLIVADTANSALRRVSTTGVVQTIAGAPTVAGSADGVASAATFSGPVGAVVDAALNVYVADLANATIRKVAVDGTVTTLAGLAGVQGSADGTGAAARFATPQGLAIDAAGNLYVADRANQVVRKVTPSGVVTTIAGAVGVPGATDGVGTAARFNGPRALAVDAAGNVYVVDDNPTVRRIAPGGVVTTIAGASGRVGAVDGPASVASFRTLRGITVDAAGSLFVTDTGNATVRKITSGGVVTTVAGTALATGSVDGTGAAARFTTPTGIVLDSAGNLYVSDAVGTVRKIDPSAVVTTVAGVADNLGGVLLGLLPGHLDHPSGLGIDSNDNVYVTDMNGVIRITFR